MPFDLTVSEISQRLANRAPEVAAILLPGGRLFGQEWLCGDLNGGAGESLKVHVYGTYAGHWRDWAAGDDCRGDLLDLWEQVKGITRAEAIKEAKAFLGIVDPVRQEAPKKYTKPPAEKTSALAPQGEAIKYLTNHRHLDPAIVAALKIEGSAKHRAIVFPSYSPSGELVNRSYRTLGADKKVWQDAGCAPSLFGWQALPKRAYAEKRVLICEGQIDCASWLQWGIPALSVPNGSGCSWIDYEWDNLAPFETFLLAFDQDAAGREIQTKVLTRLGRHRCLLVELPKKDANACLQAGYSHEDASEWVLNAKTPTVDKFITARELESRTLEQLREKPEAFTLPFFRGQWPDSGFYMRPAEVTSWAGHNFSGKSIFLNFLTGNLVTNQTPTFIASMELPPETLLRKLITMYYGKQVTKDRLAEFLHHAGHLLLYADVVGYIEEAALFEMMWFAFRRYGAQHYIIDSLMRVKGLEGEYAKQGEFCCKLQSFAKETGTHVHLVCHLAKPPNAAVNERPTMYGVKGSSLIINSVDNIALIWRNPEKERLKKSGKLDAEKEKSMHDTEIIIEKQRETGWTHNYRLFFDPFRYTYRVL